MCQHENCLFGCIIVYYSDFVNGQPTFLGFYRCVVHFNLDLFSSGIKDTGILMELYVVAISVAVLWLRRGFFGGGEVTKVSIILSFKRVIFNLGTCSLAAGVASRGK